MKQRQVADAALNDVFDAIKTIEEYFTEAVMAYLRELILGGSADVSGPDGPWKKG